MQVKARIKFELEDGTEVEEGEIVELEGAQLEFRLGSDQVTKDLDWTPEDRGEQ